MATSFSLALAMLLAGVLAVPFTLGQSAGTESQQEKRPERRPFGKRRGDRGERFGGRLFSRLNLTDAQKEQMKQINQSYSERTRSLREELRARHQELRQAQNGDTFNETLATQKMTEISALQVKQMGEQFKLRKEMSSVLTPEQKTQLEQLREQMKTKREQFKSGRGERRAN
ncbi:MAG: Spy/CpxP family protein refolding chaperone [Acidobacteria bacterium]|nr:Spy/CpxP family protein refolding chaperone [Acidobacteriota bacterium]